MELPPEVDELLDGIREWWGKSPYDRWFLVKREGEHFTIEFGKGPRNEATSFPKQSEGA